MNVPVELLAQRLIDPGVDGAAVLLDLGVVPPKGILGEIAEYLGDAEVWDVEKVIGLFRADGVDDGVYAVPRPRKIKGLRQVVTQHNVGIEKQIQHTPPSIVAKDGISGRCALIHFLPLT
jgi:hypothetical protein